MRVMYQPSASRAAGPFKYIERGYVRGLQKAGCEVELWDGLDPKSLRAILEGFRPEIFIGYLRGNADIRYECNAWTRPPHFGDLLAYRRKFGLKVALRTHPDVNILTRLLHLEVALDDPSGAGLYYAQPPPPLEEEQILAAEQFVDLILHSFSRYVGQTCFPYWRNLGIPVLEEPLAADDAEYFPPASPVPVRYPISYIGGWWPFKAQQLEKFTTPLRTRFGEDLHLFGRNWPGGSSVLPDEAFNATVWASAVNLTFHEPSQVQGIPVHVNERIFKLYACRGFVLADNNPCLEEYFEPDEMESCRDPEEMLDKSEFFLRNPSERERKAHKGFQAVMRRHTYKIRAETMLAHLAPVTRSKTVIRSTNHSTSL